MNAVTVPDKVALTGTPGVGKTTVASLVQSRPVLYVNILAEREGAIVGFDDEMGSAEVDTERLAAAVSEMEGPVLLEGHLSHLLGVGLAIVLRCSPSVLAARLLGKGWSEPKTAENLEAEAVDVILVESLETVPSVCEIDTTNMAVEDVARAVEEILSGESQKYPVGNVDWSQEVLSWF
jgi:adenylate kinase